jgi:hypothetical protein
VFASNGCTDIDYYRQFLRRLKHSSYRRYQSVTQALLTEMGRSILRTSVAVVAAVAAVEFGYASEQTPHSIVRVKRQLEVAEEGVAGSIVLEHGNIAAGSVGCTVALVAGFGTRAGRAEEEVVAGLSVPEHGNTGPAGCTAEELGIQAGREEEEEEEGLEVQAPVTQ